MMSIRLPVAPSVNVLYANRKGGKGRGRFKTAAYKTWLAEADLWFHAQKLARQPTITGPCEIKIRLPKIRGDISNRIKATEDYLVSRLVTGDDKNNRKVSIETDESLTGFCVVEVRAA